MHWVWGNSLYIHILVISLAHVWCSLAHFNVHRKRPLHFFGAFFWTRSDLGETSMRMTRIDYRTLLSSCWFAHKCKEKYTKLIHTTKNKTNEISWKNIDNFSHQLISKIKEYSHLKLKTLTQPKVIKIQIFQKKKKYHYISLVSQFSTL